MKLFLQTITSGLVLSFFFTTLSFAQFESVKTVNNESINLNDPKTETWIHWDDGENVNSIGIGTAGTWYGFIRFETTDLEAYEGMELTTVRVHLNHLADNAAVVIWTGTEGDFTEQSIQDFAPVEEQWVEIVLDNPYVIDSTVELWIGIEIGDPGDGSFPLGCDATTDADGKGNLVTFDGSTFELLSDFGIAGDWNIQALVITDDELFEVTFIMNMYYVSEYFNPDLDMVYITGEFLNWAEPGDEPEQQTMIRFDDSFFFTQTFQLQAGEYEYKYFLNEGWSGGEWEGPPDRIINVTGNMTVEDLWMALPGSEIFAYLLTLLANPVYAGSVAGGASFLANAIVQTYATPAESYVFLNWTDNNESIVSTDAKYQFNMPREPLTLTANFDGGNFVYETEELQVRIFPNPAQEYFIIRSASLINDISIIDISGKIIYKQSPNSYEVRIDQNWDAGAYIVRIITAEGAFARKAQIR